MARIRCEITNATVAEAMRLRSPGDGNLTDFADTRIPGLILRVRGVAVSWMFKTSATSKKLGSPPETGVREARRQAELELGRHNAVKHEKPISEAVEALPAVWTWKQVADYYIGHISCSRMIGNKEKKPSPDTTVDAKRAMGRPALQSWQDMPVTELGPLHLVDAVRETIDGVSYRQAAKLFAYCKSALTLAISNRARESGLTQTWWTGVRMPQPSGEVVERIVARQRSTAKDGFGLEQVAEVLHRHEIFCNGRTGRDKISPGVRWGLWWYALTVVRGGAATQLALTDVKYNDPFLSEGWALAKYRAEVMKCDIDHWLPIPPLGVRILESVRRDWKQMVKEEHGDAHDSQWCFPSSRRDGRKPDPNVTASGLSLHIKSMRGERTGHRNHLEGIPYFTPHSLRSAAASFLGDRRDVMDADTSAFLSHRLPVDPKIEQMSQTTRKYYDQAQRIESKTVAISSWSDALVAEYKRIGGIMPV